MLNDLFESLDIFFHFSGLDRIDDSHHFMLFFFRRGDDVISFSLKYFMVYLSNYCPIGCKKSDIFGVLEAALYLIQSAFNNTYEW